MTAPDPDSAGAESVNTPSTAVPVRSDTETSSHAFGWPPHSGTTQPVDVPTFVAIVVAEQVERDLRDRDHDATVGREAWMDRVAGIDAAGNRRHLGRRAGLAIGPEDRSALVASRR